MKSTPPKNGDDETSYQQNKIRHLLFVRFINIEEEDEEYEEGKFGID